MSELRTHITAEEKTHAIVRKEIPDTMTGLLERINDGK